MHPPHVLTLPQKGDLIKSRTPSIPHASRVGLGCMSEWSQSARITVDTHPRARAIATLMVRDDTRNRWTIVASAIVVASVVCLIVLAFGSTFLSIRDSRARALKSFAQAQAELQETEHARELLESRIESLRTHVDAVRLQARNEFRLMMPGEHIEVITIDKSSERTPRVVATTLP